MPFSYAIEEGCLRITGTGVLTDEDLNDHTRLNLGRFARVLYDLSNVTGARLDAELVRNTGRDRDQCSFMTPETKLAIVAPRDVLYGLGRMHAILSGEHRSRVFRTMEEAAAWLGISPDSELKENSNE